MSASANSLASLLKQADIEDHDDLLKAADAVLKQSKGDLNTQQVKVVALLKLDRHEDAVKAVEAGGANLKEQARLEYAYALYKSGRASDAVEIAREGDDRGYKHVEAQARYRIEDFEGAAEIYDQLASALEDDAEADLRINAGAIDAQLEWSGKGELVQEKKPVREDLEAFETAYNAACGSIARNELAQGEVLLKRARDLCNALEDMAEEDKVAELLPITVQQVYVLARLEKFEEAAKLVESIETKNILEASTRHIAQINGVAASLTPANPYLAHRLVTIQLDMVGPDHPFEFQSLIIKQDRYAVDLQSLKRTGVVDSTASAIAKHTAPTLGPLCNSLSVVNAAAHAKSETRKEALKHVLPLLQKRPNDVGLILTIVQLYVLTGNSGSAINLLEGFLKRLEQPGSAAESDVRFAPGLVGAMVSLYQSRGRRGQVQKELAKAAIHWRRKSKDRPHGTTLLLKVAGSTLLDSHDSEHHKLSSEIFDELHSQDPDDRYASAGVLAASHDGTPSSTTSSSLTPIDRLISDIDAEALETAGIAQPPPAPGAAVITKKRPGEEIKRKKPAKISKSRMPKDYDPSKTPDPERWLPLRDRSTYRPKGKKGKARANLLSQGAAPSGDSDGSRPGTPGHDVVKQKQQGGGGGGGGKKKKGKGSKW